MKMETNAYFSINIYSNSNEILNNKDILFHWENQFQLYLRQDTDFVFISFSVQKNKLTLRLCLYKLLCIEKLTYFETFVKSESSAWVSDSIKDCLWGGLNQAFTHETKNKETNEILYQFFVCM